MKITFVPEQIVLPGDAEILTVGAAFELTFIVIALDITGFGLAQDMEEFISHVTISLFANVEF